MLTYAMLTYADVCGSMRLSGVMQDGMSVLVCMLPYADLCYADMLMYANVCGSMRLYGVKQDGMSVLCVLPE